MEFPFDELKFREVDGIPDLVIAIAQDFESGEVLMIAFTNREGIQKTIETGKVHYFSTSRKKLWLKGETSGHVQRVKDILIDCDGDAMLFRVEQEGAACHKGYRSCFFRKVGKGGLKTISEKVFEPKDVY